MATSITVANLVTNLQAKDDSFSSGLQGATRTATSWAANMGKTVAKVGLAAIAGGAAIAATGVIGLATAIGKLTMDASAVQGTVNTFKLLAQSIGSEAEPALQGLRVATRGMVADADLMAAGNKFMAMGLADTAEGAAELAEVATQLGMAMGEDATGSMENFALMMANQSIPRLDSFGISSSKVRDRIKELMDETAGLSREAAFNQAVMEQSALTMEKVGEQSDTAAGSMANIKTSVENAKLAIGQAFIPVLEQLLVPLKGIIADVGPKLIEWAQTAAEWMGEKVPQAIAWAQEAFSGVLGVITGFQEEGLFIGLENLFDLLGVQPSQEIWDLANAFLEFKKQLAGVVEGFAEEGLFIGLENLFSMLNIEVTPAFWDFLNVLLEFVNNIGPQVTAFWNDTLLPAFQEAKDFIEQNLTPIIGGLEGAFAGLAVALAGGAIAALISGVGTAIAAVATPVAALIAIGALIGAAWAGNWGGIRDIVHSVVYETIIPAFTKVKAWFEQNWPIIQAVALTAWTVISDIALTVADIFLNQVWPSLQSAFESIKEALALLGVDWEMIGGIVKGVLAVIAALVLAAVGVVVGFVSGVAAAFANMAAMAAEQIANVKRIIGGIKDFFTNLVAAVKAVLAGDWVAANELWAKAVEGAKEVLRGILAAIWTQIKATFGTIYAFIEGFVTGVIGFFQGLYDKLVGHSIISDLMADMETLISDGLAIVEGLWEAFKDNVVGFAETLKTDLDTKWDNIKTALETIWGTIKTSAETAAQNVWDAITTKIDEIKTAIDGTWTDIKGAVAAAWELIKTAVETAIGILITATTTKFDTIKTNIDTIWALIKAAAVTAWGAIKDKIEEKIQDVVDKVVELFTNMVDTAKGYVADFVQLGQDLLDGLIEGIMIKALALYQKVREVIEGALAIGRREARAESPSMEWFDLGVDFMDGLIEGVQSRMEYWHDILKEVFDVGGVLSGLGSKAVSAFRRSFIDPHQEVLDLQKERLANADAQLEKLREAGGSAEQIAFWEHEREGHIKNIAVETERINAAEFATAQLQKQKDRLSFLKQQSDLLAMIEEQGLDYNAVMGDTVLGGDADPLAIMEATTRALKAIADRMGDELANIVNPFLPVVGPGPDIWHGPAYDAPTHDAPTPVEIVNPEDWGGGILPGPSPFNALNDIFAAIAGVMSAEVADIIGPLDRGLGADLHEFIALIGPHGTIADLLAVVGPLDRGFGWRVMEAIMARQTVPTVPPPQSSPSIEGLAAILAAAGYDINDLGPLDRGYGNQYILQVTTLSTPEDIIQDFEQLVAMAGSPVR